MIYKNGANIRVSIDPKKTLPDELRDVIITMITQIKRNKDIIYTISVRQSYNFKYQCFDVNINIEAYPTVTGTTVHCYVIDFINFMSLKNNIRVYRYINTYLMMMSIWFDKHFYIEGTPIVKDGIKELQGIL